MGIIPDMESWKINVDYKIQKEKIKNLKDIKLNQTEIDLAVFHGKNLKDAKKEALMQEKIRLMNDLNKKFGVEEEEENIKVDIDNNVNNNKNVNDPAHLWKILQGKGIINNGI